MQGACPIPEKKKLRTQRMICAGLVGKLDRVANSLYTYPENNTSGLKMQVFHQPSKLCHPMFMSDIYIEGKRGKYRAFKRRVFYYSVIFVGKKGI